MLNYKNIIYHGTTFKTIYVGVWNNNLYNKWFHFMNRVQLSHDCRITVRRQFTLNHQVHSSWHSFGESQRDERLRRPASHKVVLNQWPINWKSCTISTTPLYRLGSTILNPFKNGIKNGGNKQTTIRTVWNNALNCVSLTQHQKPIPLCVIYTAHDICNYT